MLQHLSNDVEQCLKAKVSIRYDKDYKTVLSLLIHAWINQRRMQISRAELNKSAIIDFNYNSEWDNKSDDKMLIYALVSFCTFVELLLLTIIHIFRMVGNNPYPLIPILPARWVFADLCEIVLYSLSLAAIKVITHIEDVNGTTRH